MIARPASSSRPADRRLALGAGLLALVVFLGSWWVIHRGFYTHAQIVDTPVYEGYGDKIEHGRIPYRDFGLEYPPGALPVFVLPSLTAKQGDLPEYTRGFERLMALCGLAGLAFLALALRSLGADAARVAGVLGFAALAPLALGSVVLSRFDLWPTALAVAALAALLAGRERVGLGTLALGTAAKVFPGVLLGPALAYVWRRHGRREALVCGGIFLGVLALCVVPFIALSPHGVWSGFTRQASRPLQIESLGSSFLLAAHQLWGLGLVMVSSSGSQNLGGSTPHAFGVVQSVLQVAAVLGLWVAFARGPAERERLVRYAAACLVAFVALGKVVSPQFLIWLVPFVPLVRGRRGAGAACLLALILVCTQLWFPFRYWSLALHFAAFPSWLVLARDLLLVALLAILAWPVRERRPAPTRS